MVDVNDDDDEIFSGPVITVADSSLSGQSYCGKCGIVDLCSLTLKSFAFHVWQTVQ